MNIEFKFLQKAIEEKNYVSFTYENIKHENIKPMKLIETENIYFLHTNNEIFEFQKIKKLKILKERF